MRSALIIAAFGFIFLAGLAPAFAADQPQSATVAENPQTAPVANGPQVAIPPVPRLLESAAQPAPEVQPGEYLTQAQDAYKSGQLKQSLSLIDAAQTAIRAKRAEFYRPLLPPVPENWQANDSADSKMTLGAAMIGGMSVISREYTGYGHTIKIGYIVDSPMMKLMSGMMKVVSSMSNEDTSMEGVHGYQAIYKETRGEHKGSAHMLMVFAGDVVAILQSDTLPKETILEFANITPYDKLKTVQ